MERDAFLLHTGFGAIRSATKADTDGLLRMVGHLAEHHGDTATLTREDLARDAFGPRPWIDILVAEAESVLLGYAVLCPLMKLQLGMRGLDIHHLFIETEQRGLGVGSSLIEACKIRARAQSCRYLTVEAHPENHAAQAFYVACGFQPKASQPSRFSLWLED